MEIYPLFVQMQHKQVKLSLVAQPLENDYRSVAYTNCSTSKSRTQ